MCVCVCLSDFHTHTYTHMHSETISLLVDPLGDGGLSQKVAPPCVL